MLDALPFTSAPPSPSEWAPARPAVSQFSPTRVRWSDHRAPLTSHARGAKRVGLAYERRVTDVMSAIYGAAFTPQPCIEYVIAGRRALARPDGILRLGQVVWILEVKLGHTAMVWSQLMERYLPLVSHLEPRASIRTVEVCRSYDPSVIIPGPHRLIDSLHRAGGEMLEVLRWKI